MLEKLLRSTAEVNTLGVILFNEGLHLREIARRAGLTPSESKRELDNLVGLGLLHSEKRGNQTIFNTNPECPFFSDLKNLYLKTEGVFHQLSSSLSPLKGIDHAFVFGSAASGKDKSRSDIDLMVIGGIDEDELAKSIFKVQKQTSREINFILWTNNDLEDKINKNNSFLKNILKNRMVFIVGEKDEFVRIVEKGHVKESGS